LGVIEKFIIKKILSNKSKAVLRITGR
jgi:hypothetical protein